MRYQTSFRYVAVLFTLLASTSACRGGKAELRVEQTDSAGVAIIMTHSQDVPVTLASSPVRSLGGKDSDAESFYQVNVGNTGVDANGNIYVLERDAHRVHMFDSTGVHIRSLGARGGGPGELQFPLGLAVSADGTIRVADARKRKFVQWNPEGQPIEELAMPLGYMGGTFASTGAGTVVPVGLAGEQRLVRIAASGTETNLATITGLPVKDVELKSCGMGFGNMSPIFSPEFVWAADGDRVVIARNPDYIIDEYVGGKLVRSFRRNVALQAATAEAAKASLGDGLRVRVQGGPDRVCDTAEVVEQQGFAPYLPAIERIAIAPDGRLWVQRYTPGDEPGAIDLFDSGGRYLGTVADGSGFPMRFLPDGRILTSEKDDMQLERLVIRTAGPPI